MRTAYVTTLCGGDAYTPGVEALGRSLAESGTSAPRLAMVTSDVTSDARARLRTQGWQLVPIDPIESPSPEALVRIDPEGRRVFLHGQEVQLTGKEFELLKVLVANEGKVVSREKLMRDVWDSAWYGSTKTLDMHISVLRRKLGDDASHPSYITTIRGVGFRFDAPQD